MDGENNGSKPYEQMDDLGGFPIIFGNTHIIHIYSLARFATCPQDACVFLRSMVSLGALKLGVWKSHDCWALLLSYL